jgi:hypothetical protein
VTVKGDMSAYAFSKTGVDMETCRRIIEAALESANDPNFALRFQEKTECASSFLDYFDVVRFLQEVN